MSATRAPRRAYRCRAARRRLPRSCGHTRLPGSARQGSIPRPRCERARPPRPPRERAPGRGHLGVHGVRARAGRVRGSAHKTKQLEARHIIWEKKSDLGRLLPSAVRALTVIRVGMRDQPLQTACGLRQARTRASRARAAARLRRAPFPRARTHLSLHLQRAWLRSGRRRRRRAPPRRAACTRSPRTRRRRAAAPQRLPPGAGQRTPCAAASPPVPARLAPNATATRRGEGG